MWTSEFDILSMIIGRCWWLPLTLLFIDQPEPDCDSNLSLTSVKNISMKGQIDLKIFEKNPDNFNFQWPVCHLSFQKLLEPTNFNFFEFETMNERMLTLLWMKQQHLVLKLLLIHLNEEHSKQFANNLHRLIPVLRRHTELWLHSCLSFSLVRSIALTLVLLEWNATF